MPRAPSDIMIGAGGIPTHSDCPDNVVAAVVEREAAAEHVDASDLVADHRIIGGAEARGRSLVAGFGIHGITFLESEQAASGLDRREEVCRGESEDGAV